MFLLFVYDYSIFSLSNLFCQYINVNLGNFSTARLFSSLKYLQSLYNSWFLFILFFQMYLLTSFKYRPSILNFKFSSSKNVFWFFCWMYCPLPPKFLYTAVHFYYMPYWLHQYFFVRYFLSSSFPKYAFTIFFLNLQLYIAIKIPTSYLLDFLSNFFWVGTFI